MGPGADSRRRTGLSLTDEMVRELIVQYVGTDVGEAEATRLRPLLERQIERMNELAALDLGADDPRTMFYIVDRRLTSVSDAGGVS